MSRQFIGYAVRHANKEALDSVCVTMVHGPFFSRTREYPLRILKEPLLMTDKHFRTANEAWNEQEINIPGERRFTKTVN